METAIFRKLGLTDSQAKGYLMLVKYGALTPAELAQHTSETRTNAYAIADRLVELGLTTKTTQPKTTYQAESPAKLKQLLLSQQQELKSTSSELTGALPALMSLYRLTSDKPGTIYLEGVDSLRIVYDDVIKTGQTVRIFPSSHDRDDPEVAAMIDRQIERQRSANIRLEVLLPNELAIPTADELFEARPAGFGRLDTQVLIYGDNVALTTFHTGVVTTVLTSPLIAQTFGQLFQAFWGSPSAASVE